jgi:hypothetical protein
VTLKRWARSPGSIWLASMVAIAAAGCSAATPADLSTQPVLFVPDVSPTPTPLAFESTAPAATGKTGAFYKPPGWDGSSDVNCSAFDTKAHAQSFFNGTGGTPTNDPYGLDGDHDGKACETLP